MIWFFDIIWRRYIARVRLQEGRSAMLRRNGYRVIGGRVEEAVPPWMVQHGLEDG